jgi:hypothetical protein
MNRALRILTDLGKRYAQRDTPVLGGPWWVYVVAIGTANIARQVFLPDLSSAVQIATFLVTIVTVGGAVALAFRLANRSSARHTFSDGVRERDVCLRA